MSSAWNAKVATIAVTLICTIGVASCGDDDSTTSASSSGSTETKAYPAAVKDGFQKSCVSSAQTSSGGKLTAEQAGEICTKSLACIEEKLTIKEFEKAESNMLEGNENPDAKVLTKCAEDAAKEVTK